MSDETAAGIAARIGLELAQARRRIDTFIPSTYKGTVIHEGSDSTLAKTIDEGRPPRLGLGAVPRVSDISKGKFQMRLKQQAKKASPQNGSKTGTSLAEVKTTKKTKDDDEDGRTTALSKRKAGISKKSRSMLYIDANTKKRRA